ncbi:MAG: hypothetical protein Q8M56_10115, partial [Desulfobacterales bacterium]|nr:hypothetical protein [Desulfobacterales bacterium]
KLTDGFVKSHSVRQSSVADCASSFVIAAYQYVRFIPQDSRALHNELFTLPSKIRFLQVIKIDDSEIIE